MAYLGVRISNWRPPSAYVVSPLLVSVVAGETVGLVLAGGGARGAYEVGALSVLLPYLERRGERPRVFVGTSVGALTSSYLAARAHEPAQRVVDGGCRLWSEMTFEQVLEPVVSLRALAKIVRYLGQFLGVPGIRIESLLDPAPLRDTVRRAVCFGQLERNLAAGALEQAAVVATSALTSRSVVFHRGGASPAADPARGIDYVGTEQTAEQVCASAAIPGVFPAVHVAAPARAGGWYYDGGARLNTPIKPALELGAERVVVIAAHSIAAGPDQLAGERPPDALEGAGQIVQALLVDPLVHDVRTLATVNRIVHEAGGDREAGSAAGKRSVPYIFVAPRRRHQVGELAMLVFRAHYKRVKHALRSPDLALLGRIVAGGSDPLHGDLLSYLLFAPEFARALIELGRRDAERWLAQPHDDGPWQLGPLPPDVPL